MSENHRRTPSCSPYVVSASDRITFTFTTFLACWIPARRISRVDPVVATGGVTFRRPRGTHDVSKATLSRVLRRHHLSGAAKN